MMNTNEGKKKGEEGMTGRDVSSERLCMWIEREKSIWNEKYIQKDGRFTT